MASEFLGVGWRFPVKPAGGHLGLIDGDEKIQQSIWIILSTSPGERLMRPDLGCGIYDLVFQPNTAALRGLVQQKVRESLTRWEPRIDVTDVRVETAPDDLSQLLIRIDYRIRENNAFYNLVYPFYLTEGPQ